jgi:hypothetical protein
MKNRGLLAALLALCTMVPAGAMTTDRASIIALVRQTKALTLQGTFVRFAGDGDQAGGDILPDFAAAGLLEGGTRVIAVPLESGGSGGVFTQILFAQGVDDAEPYYLGAITSGGHLNVNVTYHGIVATYPDYGANDPNCCPSKYAIDTYTIDRHALKRVSSRVVKKP